MSMIIDYIKIEDAKGYGKFLEKIDSETKTLLWEPGERRIDEEFQKKRIESIDEEKHELAVVSDP